MVKNPDHPWRLEDRRPEPRLYPGERVAARELEGADLDSRHHHRLHEAQARESESEPSS